MTALLLCTMMALQDDAAATTALETFNKAWTKEKTGDGRATAVTELAKTLHEKVCVKLSSLLTSEDKQVRLAAAPGLGTFNTTPELKKSASKALCTGLTAGANSNDPETKIAILTALGALNEETSAAKVKDHFDDKDNKIASAAVAAAGNIKSKTLVEPLIEILKECEQEIKKATTLPQGVAGKAGKMPAPAKKAPAAPSPANDPEKVKKDRANALLGPSQTALCILTNQGSLKTSEEFEKWWAKNRSNFPPK
jgi:hypothetical protein